MNVWTILQKRVSIHNEDPWNVCSTNTLYWNIIYDLKPVAQKVHVYNIMSEVLWKHKNGHARK